MTTNRAFLGAWKKGYEAGKAGEPEGGCPYAKTDSDDTYSPAFARHWKSGYAVGAAERERAAATTTIQIGDNEPMPLKDF